ncbi:cell wall hydrolase [Caulobacter sp. S45]|uniref:cell wall hydrolase n=1 Tax=Caulobacter sp. S45 TaxID=1641861 RepID=UPI0015772129|nr:cell wall hydrolase [Caulobacter sp. S45]
MVSPSGAPDKAPLRPELALRDRFRVAAQAFHAAARPFRFQQVADAPSDLHCLTEAVYFEARGEAAAGQQAVAQVVLNRVRHPAFPKTICAVVHQHTGASCQFSFACSGRSSPIEAVAWRRAEAIASGEMHGAVMAAVGDATQFQAAGASPFAGLLKVAQVGAHMFYRFGGHAGAPAMFHQAPAASTEAVNIQLARLEAAPGSKAIQPAAGGRVEVTLYPTPSTPPLTASKPEAAAVKGMSATSTEAKPTPALPAGSSLTAPSPAKPAVIPVALALS